LEGRNYSFKEKLGVKRELTIIFKIGQLVLIFPMGNWLLENLWDEKTLKMKPN